MITEYDIYPARRAVIYDWRKRRHKLALVGDLGRTMPVTPADDAGYEPVESWTLDDCIRSVLRKAPDGLTAHEIAARMEVPAKTVQDALAAGKGRRYTQIGKRASQNGRWRHVWSALDNLPPKQKKTTTADRVADLLRTTPGLTAHDIAAQLGIAYGTVFNTLKAGGDRFRPCGETAGELWKPRTMWAIVS